MKTKRNDACSEFAFIGDLHLDKLLKYWPEANTLQLGAVRRVLDSCLSAGITTAFFLGDIAEGIRDSTKNAIRLSEDAQCQFLHLLMDYDGRMHLHIYLGNHDQAEKNLHSLQVFFEMQARGMFKTVRFYDKPTKIRADGVPIHVMPWPHTQPDPRAAFALAHYEVRGAVGDSGRTLHGDMFEFDVPVVQGHLHTKQRVRNHIYPGTLYQTSFGERLPKGYGIGRVVNGKFKYRWEEIDPPFKLINLTVETKADLKKLTDHKYTLYKLFVDESVRIPEALLVKYPNIVNALQFSDAKELESLQQAELDIETADQAFDHRDFLTPYLQSQNATKWQIKRAKELLKVKHE